MKRDLPLASQDVVVADKDERLSRGHLPPRPRLHQCRKRKRPVSHSANRSPGDRESNVEKRVIADNAVEERPSAVSDWIEPEETTSDSSEAEDDALQKSDPHALLSKDENEQKSTICRFSRVPKHAWHLPTSDLRTGIVVEVASQHFDRNQRSTKERPRRIESIIKALSAVDTRGGLSLLDRCLVLGDSKVGCPHTVVSRLVGAHPTPLLRDADYQQIHLPGYLERLGRLSSRVSQTLVDQEAGQYDSVFLTPQSYTVAKRAADALCRLTADVVSGRLDNGFAVIRPPGHHAQSSMACGYCLINNVAISASFARSRLGVRKVLIVDWDVHHGNGTQSMFLDDPNVLYFSLHRWHGGRFFPFLSTGGPTIVGEGDGKGFTVNVGWTRNEMGDNEYLAVWECLLMPMAREFAPDLVLVSAGFDSAQGDSMGECNVTPEGYAELTRQLMSLSSGKVVMALEGGYVESVLGRCVANVVKTLLERSNNVATLRKRTAAVNVDRVRDLLARIDPVAAQNIRSTMQAHCTYWKCLEPFLPNLCCSPTDGSK